MLLRASVGKEKPGKLPRRLQGRVEGSVKSAGVRTISQKKVLGHPGNYCMDRVTGV